MKGVHSNRLVAFTLSKARQFHLSVGEGGGGERAFRSQWVNELKTRGGGGGVIPYMGYIGMCGPKGLGFSAVLVINRVSILANFLPFWL